MSYGSSSAPDIAIVGGGPVGLFAACAAVAAGFEVTVIEKRSGVPDKACGEGLMPAALKALHQIGVDPVGRDFRGIRYLDATGQRQVHATLTRGRGRGVRRTALVEALQDRADQVGVVHRSARVVGHRQDPDCVRLFLDGGDECVAPTVLACDGLSSDLRRQTGLDVEARGPVRFGLRRHFSVAPWSDDVEVYWAHDGEAYVTPVAHNLVGVALLGRPGATFEARLLDFPALCMRLGSAEEVGAVLGAGPLRRRARRPRAGGVLLVGDAAGYVDALTGEGLAIGFGAAQAAVAAVASGDIKGYDQQWRHVTRRFRWSTAALLAAVTPPRTRRGLMSAASHLPGAFSVAVNRLS
ncbi:MAG: FAD-dependent monooxygenase [Actinomycetes bacterium]